VSLASLTAGALSIRHPPASVRIIGLVLVLLGATSFGWFAWWFAGSTPEAHRLMATFNEGSRLYWNETVRCEANFEKRFGSIQHSDQPCYGDLVVTSRSPGANPYTRIVVNDKAETSLLFCPEIGMEATAGLRERALAKLDKTPDGGLLGKGDSGLGLTQLRLRPAAVGRLRGNDHTGW
jgi:hypothetical protein